MPRPLPSEQRHRWHARNGLCPAAGRVARDAPELWVSDGPRLSRVSCWLVAANRTSTIVDAIRKFRATGDERTHGRGSAKPGAFAVATRGSGNRAGAARVVRG